MIVFFVMKLKENLNNLALTTNDCYL